MRHCYQAVSDYLQKIYVLVIYFLINPTFINMYKYKIKNMEIQVKYCKFCKKEKEFKEFNKHKACTYGISNKCKQCVYEYRNKYNKVNKNKILIYNINFNKTYNKKWAEKNVHICRWREILNRCLIYKGKKKNSKTEKMLGYSVNVFKYHIESMFIGDMNWDNVQIDHKIPLSWFNKDTPVNLINHLDNLQPLISKENTAKLNRFSHPIIENYYTTIKKYIKSEYINQIFVSPKKY